MTIDGTLKSCAGHLEIDFYDDNHCDSGQYNKTNLYAQWRFVRQIC